MRLCERRDGEWVRGCSVDSEVQEADEEVLPGGPADLSWDDDLDHVVGEGLKCGMHVDSVVQHAPLAGKPGQSIQRCTGPEVVPGRNMSNLSS